MRRRSLSAEERALWARAMRTVTPLHPDAAPPEPAVAPPPAPAEAPPDVEPRAPIRKVGASADTMLPPLDRRTAQRLRRGRFPIDGSFDLHGHTQASAHAALLAFLLRARAKGWRHVLVVTGRGSAGGGILKRSVPRWLVEPAFARHVTGFTEAGPRHGGEGALYVVLRRGQPNG